MEKPVDGKCAVCGGKIIDLIVSEHDPMWGLRIVGPGSRRQQRDVSKGYQCESCGFVPQKKQAAQQ